MLKAVEERSPDYMSDYEKIFNGEYLYNYNLFVAKGRVVDELCSWMFPVFARFEELCRSEGVITANKHISYLSESMMTWFFMKNADSLKIAHTGRILRI